MTAEVVIKEFNYAVLSAEDRIVVQERTRDIQARVRKTSEMVVEIGLDLTQVRERLKQDALWMDWLSAELGWSHETARRYIQVAERFGARTPQIVDFAPSVLYMLAAPSTPEAAVEEAIDRAQAGAPPTVAAAKEIIAAHRPPPLRPLPPSRPPPVAEEEELARASPPTAPSRPPAALPATPAPAAPAAAAPPALQPLPATPTPADPERHKHLVLRRALLEAALEATRAELAALPASELTWSVPATTLTQAARMFIDGQATRLAVASLGWSATEGRPAAPLGGDLADVVRRLTQLEDRTQQPEPPDLRLLQAGLDHVREDLDDLAEILDDEQYNELATRCTAVGQWLKERS